MLFWLGQVVLARAEFNRLKRPKTKPFQSCLLKHCQCIPCYADYQRLGLSIGFGSDESKIKQIAARIKITRRSGSEKMSFKFSDSS